MAAPTDIRVEAVAQTIAVLRWTYAGSNGLGVYRSTDGAAYSVITAPLLISTDQSYEDTGLVVGTKYWYKVSDDVGATFSDVVTVWTHDCATPTENIGIALPRFADEADPAQLNDLALTVESALNRGLSAQTETCKACISDGALIVDCGCEEMEVEVDQDINSISVLNCDDKSTNVLFIIPPNVTRAIGGWPKGMGFTGDEGFTSPVAGGSSGRSINEFVNRALNKNQQSGKSKPGVTTQGTKSGGTGGGGGRQCVGGTNGELTLKVRKPNGQANTGNSLNCSSADKGILVEACGGRGPYTFSSTGSVVLSRTTGIVTMVTPPANAGSAVAGNAYWQSYFSCNGCAAGACNVVTLETTVLRGCDDTSSGCTGSSSCTPPAASAATCGCGVGSVGQAGCGASPPTCVGCGTHTCASYQAGDSGGRVQVLCDQRTAPMIAAGCSPCGLNAGATVSVTDALGTVTTIVLTA